jgi:hypothetical protein
MTPVLVVGLSSTHLEGQYSVVLQELTGKKRLVVPVTPFEAKAIALSLENVRMPRPQTHDLIKTLLDNCEARLNKVVIYDVREDGCYAQVTLSSGVGGSDIEAQPGDAIALALRTHTSIFVRQGLLQTHGTTSLSDGHPVGRDRQLKELREQLQQAVQHENFEDAARLRDIILRLNQQTP